METTLHYKDSRSDKVYVVSIEATPGVADRFDVYGTNGASGGHMTKREKGHMMRLDEAQGLHDQLVKEKVNHRKTPYRIVKNASAPVIQSPAAAQGGVDGGWNNGLPDHMLLNEIPVERAAQLIEDNDWLLQPKWDGIRCRIGKVTGSGEVGAISRTGRPITLPWPIVEFVSSSFPQTVVFDGELVGESYVVFDLLKEGEQCYWERTAEYRSQSLAALFKKLEGQARPVSPTVTAYTREQKANLYRALLATGVEGSVFKHKAWAYTAGRSSNHALGIALKYKFVHSASVISGGQRANVSARTGEQKRSVTMHLFDGTAVGSVTIPPNKAIPPKGQVVEVRYLYRHDIGGDLVQAVYLHPREDVKPEDCTAKQFRTKGRPKE